MQKLVSLKQPSPGEKPFRPYYTFCFVLSLPCTLFFWPLFSTNRGGRKKGEKVISSCYFVLAKGNIQSSETYTGFCKQGTGEYGQILSRTESSSVGKWVKEQEPGRRTKGKLENCSTGKQRIRQNTDKHVGKSKTAKIHARPLENRHSLNSSGSKQQPSARQTKAVFLNTWRSAWTDSFSM